MLKGRLKYLALPLFLAGVVLIVYLQFTSGRSIDKLIEGNQRLLNDLESQAMFQKLESDVLLVESNVRGAIITKDTSYLRGVDNEVMAIEKLITRLDSTIKDPQMSVFMTRLDSLVVEKIEFNQHLVSAFRAGLYEDAARLVDSDRGQIIRDSIVTVINKLDSTRQAEVSQTMKQIEENGENARNWGFVLAVIAGFICIVAFWHFVSQGKMQRKMIGILDTSKENLKVAAKVKEQFMANMSHEIRTPMNAILGFTNLLQKTKLTIDQKQYVQNIQSSGENLLNIVNDILDLSKIEAGMMRIESAPFSIRGLMDSIKTMFSEKARRKGLGLYVTIADDIPDTLSGDSVRLTQIIVNLLSNAIKFTMQGHISVLVNIVERKQESIKLEFLIVDTGIGIAAEKQKAIFDRFQQAEAETTRRYGGTGLGLSIVKQLVELQKGDISIQSTPGKGSRFSFMLPFLIGPATSLLEASEVGLQDAESGLKGLKVLVVEDNLMNQQLMRHLLASWKLDFDLVENGEEAIKMLKLTKYDLVLMDIQMPVMDGYKTTQKIREELNSDVLIIAMTAHAMAGEREKCISFGMNDYISKPIKESELYRLVKKHALKEKKQNDEPGEVIKLDYLKELSAGDKKFEKEIIEQFIKVVPQEIESLKKAIDNRDFRQIYQVAHSMKSSVSYLGLTSELGPHLHEIEKQSSNGAQLNVIESSFKIIRATCIQAVEEARTLLSAY